MNERLQAYVTLLERPDEACMPPRRHRRTQFVNESKAEATWRHAVACYLGDRRGWHGEITQRWVGHVRRRAILRGVA